MIGRWRRRLGNPARRGTSRVRPPTAPPSARRSVRPRMVWIRRGLIEMEGLVRGAGRILLGEVLREVRGELRSGVTPAQEGAEPLLHGGGDTTQEVAQTHWH